MQGATLRADPQRLTQALVNLLQNVAEHAKGDGLVRFGVLGESSSWRFEVSDDGGGLPPGDERAVFEPFEHRIIASRGYGTGPVHSPGYRTSPRRRVRRHEPAGAGRHILDQDSAVKLLVVEDEERVASFLKKGLRAHGYSVEWVPNGHDALQRVMDPGISLVILDLGLPDLDGLEVLEGIRERGSAVPVLVLSARGRVDDRVKGSTSARTTTWPSRSRSRNCWPASGPICGPGPPLPRAWSAPAASASTWCGVR